MATGVSYHLLEKFLPGDVYHVDSIVSEREWCSGGQQVRASTY
ncbi:hypothetical protein [Chloracidobacterium thermophilum]|nr:hypothetical protein [Chloracidobacterium thermophilum]